MKNICIVTGARPNIIKVAPLIRAIVHAKEEGKDVDYKLVYTSSNDDATLEDSLFADLGIARPDVYFGVDCENLNELTGQVMSCFESYLKANPTDVVVVVDDLASAMAAAIVTKKQGILLAHIAAGTRSFDITMPKEINRLVIDGLSDMLFTAGISNNSIANREGAELSKVYMVGNVLIDNIRFLQQRMKRPALMDALSLQAGKYIVLTLNRHAIINNGEELRQLVTVVVEEARAAGVPVVAPLRGKAREEVEAMDLGVLLPEPQGYLDFSYLTASAMGVVTDSGNVAEEATFNGVPCITLNSYTEHIETVKVGTNVLVGESAEQLALMLRVMLRGEWKKAGIPDRWDGRSAERILQTIL